MTSLTSFFTAFDAAVSKTQFTSDVQSAAEGIDKAALLAALEVVLSGGDGASVSGDQEKALKEGFEFATKLVKMLKSLPGQDEQLNLYKYFKHGRGEQPAQPSFYQIESKYKYNAWKEISHIGNQKAQALYIKEVNDLIEKLGTQ